MMPCNFLIKMYRNTTKRLLMSMGKSQKRLTEYYTPILHVEQYHFPGGNVNRISRRPLLASFILGEALVKFLHITMIWYHGITQEFGAEQSPFDFNHFLPQDGEEKELLVNVIRPCPDCVLSSSSASSSAAWRTMTSL